VAFSFDIEYDHDLDGAMRFDAAKYPSVSWDSMTFVCGKGVAPDDIYEVRLTDPNYNSIIDGGERPASVAVEVSGEEIPDGGLDWLHLHFRDTRYTVASTDARVEVRASFPYGPTYDPNSGLPTYTHIRVDDHRDFAPGDAIVLERSGANEETTTVIQTGDDIGWPYLLATVTMDHPMDSYVTRKTQPIHLAEKLAEVINTRGDSVPGRYGPDQSSTLLATVGGGSSYQSGTLYLRFKSPSYHTYYGKLGNLDRILVTHGRTFDGAPNGQ
jgi:hypothetical protein